MYKDKNKIIIYFNFLIFLFNLNLYSNQDSTKIDSSGYSVPPLKSHGLISLNSTNQRLINKRNISWENYFNLSDIIKMRFPIYNLDLGQYGEIEHLSLFGSKNRSNSIAYNGIQLSNPYLLAPYNINNFSPEFFENIEIYTGSDAIILGNNSSGMLINMQEIIYNSREPYTKIFYNQAGGEYISGDFVFAKNISERMNLFLGLRSQTADNQFANNKFEFWNLRAGLRFNIDSITSLSLVENFTNHKLERNGGVSNSITGDVFDNITSFPKLLATSENEFLHHLNLTFSREYEQNKKIFTNIFFSHSLNENNLDSIIDYPNSTIDNNFSHWHTGVLAGISSFIGFLGYDAGVEFKYSHYDNSNFFKSLNTINSSIYGRGILNFTENIVLSGGARFTYYNNKLYKNYGSSLNLKKLLNSRFDFSYSENLPGFNFNNELKETNILAFYSLKKSIGNLFFAGNIFYRKINNSLIYSSILENNSELFDLNYNNISINGLSLHITYQLFTGFNITLWNIYQQSYVNSNINNDLPKFNSGFDVNYSRKVGRSEFIAGIDGSFFTKHNSFGFSPIPLINNYYQTQIENKTSYDGINAYFIVRFGQSAFVKLTADNLLNSNFYYVNLYPIPGRNFKISLFWEFFD